MSKTRNINSTVLELLGARPILFNPVFARMSGSITSGLILSQLLFWQSIVGNDIWFYKTIDELEEETCLTRSQQDTALAFWKESGIVKIEIRGVPAKRYFMVDISTLIESVNAKFDRNIAIKRRGKTALPVLSSMQI